MDIDGMYRVDGSFFMYSGIECTHSQELFHLTTTDSAVRESSLAIYSTLYPGKRAMQHPLGTTMGSTTMRRLFFFERHEIGTGVFGKMLLQLGRDLLGHNFEGIGSHRLAVGADQVGFSHQEPDPHGSSERGRSAIWT